VALAAAVEAADRQWIGHPTPLRADVAFMETAFMPTADGGTGAPPTR